jgi:hypothetical protein
MADAALIAKETLHSVIEGLSKDLAGYVTNPQKDFVRERKLPFQKMAGLLIAMGAKSIGRELIEAHVLGGDVPSASAFVQQRAKILPAALKRIFLDFAAKVPARRLYQGFRLLAADGSSVQIARNPADAETYIGLGEKHVGFNQLHVMAMYDLLNNFYTDACVQTARGKNECAGLVQMLRGGFSQPSIVVGDRGFNSLNVLAAMQENGVKFVIRAREASKCLLNSVPLPSEAEFDVQYSRMFTRRNDGFFKNRPDIYRILHPHSPFAPLDTSDRDFYPLSFRVVRIRLESGEHETLLTNLPSDTFTPNDLREIYRLRWGVETSFRKLKYAVGLKFFHSKRPDFVSQEIFARLTMFNFCTWITESVDTKGVRKKYAHQVNFTAAVLLCRFFLRASGPLAASDLLFVLSRQTLPLRPNRSCPRRPLPPRPFQLGYRP